MKRLTKSGAVSQKDINKLMELSNENQFGVNNAYYKLKEYEDAEEQGLLLKLPFKVGDTVYTPLSMSGWYLRKSDSQYKAKVVFIGLNDSREMGGGLFNVVYENRGHMIQFNFSDIGKTVFTSKEEVEKAFTKKLEDNE